MSGINRAGFRSFSYFGGNYGKTLITWYKSVPRLLAGSPICLAASLLASFFVRFKKRGRVSRHTFFSCNILSQCNIQSAWTVFRSGTTGLLGTQKMKIRRRAPDPPSSVFLLHTFARFEGPAAGVVPWALPAPQASFFCATFCNNSTSGPPN